MRRLITLLLLGMFFSGAVSSQRRRAPVPKRVEIVEAKKAPQTFGHSVVKYASSYTIKEDGSAVQTVEIQQKCVAATCLERMKKQEQIYNADLQKPRLIEASLIKKNGTRVDVTKDNGRSLPTPQAESAPDFSSLRVLEIVFDKYELGDTITHSLELSTTKPIFGNNFDSLELYPAIFEWKSIEINVSAPPGLQLYFDTTGLEGGEIAASNGAKSWRWKRSGLAAVPIETAMFDTQRMSPRFGVTTFASFEQLGAAFGEGVRRQAVITPEVQALADEITQGLKDPSDQAAAIYQWVNKNIRYLLVVLDRGGWIPHSTEQILRNRYGDCKDYTTLIHAMLKAKGIESVPVLINAQFGNWFPKVATMEYFDHAILYIPSLKLFADATSPNTRLGLIPQPLVGKTALQSGETPGLITVPKDRPDDSQLLSEVEVELLENGTLRALSHNTFAGRAEILYRPLFSDAKRSGMAESLVKLQLAFYGLTGSGRVIEVSDPHAVAEPFAIQLQAELPDFTTFAQKGSLTIPAGINSFSLATMEIFTTEERRNTDLFIGATRMLETFKVKLPAKVVLSELPAPVKFSNRIGAFELTISKTPAGFELRRQLVLLKDTLEPEEYPDFKELVSKTVASLNAEVRYTSDGSLVAKRAKRSPASNAANSGMSAVQDMMSEMLGIGDVKLSTVEVRQLEARLKVQPADIQAREKLLRHYRSYDLKETVAVVNARRDHKLWFVRNQPERSSSRLIGWYFSGDKTPEYVALRDEWKRHIARKPADIRIWLNAAEMVQYLEPELAESFLSNGKAMHPADYEFPRELSLLLADRLDEEHGNPGSRADLIGRCIANGKLALDLIKRERSDRRDSDRAELLIKLAPVALNSGDTGFAGSLARELVLDFGGDTLDPNYETAAHVGNTILGKVALANNNTVKAAEHLLISIRAPLRRPDGYFDDIDLSLASAVFRKGEKKAVSEFLSLVLKVSAYTDSPDLYSDEISAIKKWIADIDKGLEPSFDFEKP